MRARIPAIVATGLLCAVVGLAPAAPAEANWMPGRPGSGTAGGQRGAVPAPPGAGVVDRGQPEHGRSGQGQSFHHGHDAARPSPFYPPPKPYPYSINYPYYYYKSYPSVPYVGGPVYGAPGGSYWVPGYWMQQWVPSYVTYQVWVPAYYDANGYVVQGHWETQTVESGGYYDRVWVEGYWAR